MKVTLLGHASLVIEGPDGAILMDPVFSDPFQGDLVVSCPSRAVHVEALPTPRALVLSHGHLDHFHPPSLRQLDHAVDVYCPPDPELLRLLAGEGFQQVHVVKPGDRWEVAGLTLIATGGGAPEMEMGVLFKGTQGTLWNMVDTVITQDICAAVSANTDGRPDIAICTYRPLLEYAGVWLDEVEFPQARYERLLEMALCSRARTVIPGSAGLRCHSRLGWANHRLFPVSRRQFLDDLRSVAPEVNGLLLNPGQAVVLQRGAAPTVENTPYAKTLADDEDLVAFAPNEHPAPQLTDSNPFKYPESHIVAAVHALMQQHLTAALNHRLQPRLKGALRTLWDRRACVQIDVVCPTSTQHWHFKQWHPTVSLVAGAHDDPDYTFQYVGSELFGMLRGNRLVTPRYVAKRRKSPSGTGQPFRFGALDPGRLHGVDLYRTVDETFDWHPLLTLA